MDFDQSMKLFSRGREKKREKAGWWWGMRCTRTKGRCWGKWMTCRRSRLRDFLLLDIVHQPLVLSSFPVHLQLLVNPGHGILDLRQTDFSLMWQVGVSVKLTDEGGKEFVRVYVDKEEVLFGQERSSAGRMMKNNQSLHEDMSGLPVGVRTHANLGHLDSVREVWVIPTKVQEKLDKVMDMLAVPQGWEKEDHAEVGTMCVTMFSEDQVLYRAMVITLLEAGKVMVRFVDFGNQEEKFVSELRKITPALNAVEHCAVSVKTS